MADELIKSKSINEEGLVKNDISPIIKSYVIDAVFDTFKKSIDELKDKSFVVSYKYHYDRKKIWTAISIDIASIVALIGLSFIFPAYFAYFCVVFLIAGYFLVDITMKCIEPTAEAIYTNCMECFRNNLNHDIDELITNFTKRWYRYNHFELYHMTTLIIEEAYIKAKENITFMHNTYEKFKEPKY